MKKERFKQIKELMDQYDLDPYFRTSIDRYLSGTDPVMIISHLCKIINGAMSSNREEIEPDRSDYEFSIMRRSVDRPNNFDEPTVKHFQE